MADITITLSREEAMACILGLQKENYKGKPYKWAQQALKKFESIMGFK